MAISSITPLTVFRLTTVLVVFCTCGVVGARASNQNTSMISLAVDLSLPAAKASSLPLKTVSPRYVSYTLDWWPPNDGCRPFGWGAHSSVLQVNLSSPKLRALVSAMGPSFLRIGGSLENIVEYDIPGKSSCWKGGPKRPCLNASRWDELHEFARATNSKIVFGLSYPQYPHDSGIWNSSQAEALFSYSFARNYSRKSTLYGFELGEELTKFKVGTPAFENYIAAYQNCSVLLEKIWSTDSSCTSKPKLLGPSPGMDWPNLARWFPSFLNRTRGTLDVAVYHSYNQIQITPQRKLYLNMTIPSGNLSTQHGSSPGDTGWQAQAMLQFVSKVNMDGRTGQKKPLELWLGEMGPHNRGGGDGNTSFTFASSFGYLDSLGTLARLDHQVVARQALVGGKYELLRCSTGGSICDVEPYPDYWVALLWKRLMGTIVLQAPAAMPTNSGPNSNAKKDAETIRFHAHCTRSDTRMGSITVAFSNMSVNETYAISSPLKLGTRRVEYILSGHLSNSDDSPELTFNASILELNGVTMKMGHTSNLPTLKGRNTPNDAQHPLIILPVTIGFIVFPEANATICKAPVAVE